MLGVHLLLVVYDLAYYVTVDLLDDYVDLINLWISFFGFLFLEILLWISMYILQCIQYTVGVQLLLVVYDLFYCISSEYLKYISFILPLHYNKQYSI